MAGIPVLIRFQKPLFDAVSERAAEQGLSVPEWIRRQVADEAFQISDAQQLISEEPKEVPVISGARVAEKLVDAAQDWVASKTCSHHPTARQRPGDPRCVACRRQLA